MSRNKYIDSMDIARGLVEVGVDTAKRVGRSVLRMPHVTSSHGRHTFPLNHPNHPDYIDVPNPIHLNRWDSEGSYFGEETTWEDVARIQRQREDHRMATGDFDDAA